MSSRSHQPTGGRYRTRLFKNSGIRRGSLSKGTGAPYPIRHPDDIHHLRDAVYTDDVRPQEHTRGDGSRRAPLALGRQPLPEDGLQKRLAGWSAQNGPSDGGQRGQPAQHFEALIGPLREAESRIQDDGLLADPLRHGPPDGAAQLLPDLPHDVVVDSQV